MGRTAGRPPGVPGQPLFNEQTEGCLPMYVVLSDSHDLGETWTPWRLLPLPDSLGPPSLTSPILKLASGRLAVSIESNKPYLDTSKWLQHVAYAYSDDQGQTWGDAITICRIRRGGFSTGTSVRGWRRAGRLSRLPGLTTAKHKST
jgi:hypothetical protein